MDASLTLGEVLTAIEILPDVQQAEVLGRLKRDGGLTPEFAERISALIDAQIRMETGSAEGIDEERRMLDAVGAAAARQKKPVALPPDAQELALDDEVAEQRATYEQWLQDVDRIDREAGRKAEGARRMSEAEEVESLKQMLKQDNLPPAGQ